MKKFLIFNLRFLKEKAGFTMIELLIVIAVLGILATAVLSAINPIEQINRGKDTGTRSDAEQLIGAIDRFYTASGYYPWMVSASSTNTAVTPMVVITSSTQTFGVDAQPVLTNLSSGGAAEIKASFVTRIVSTGATKLALYYSGVSGESTYVCFVPKSSSFRNEAWNRCKTTLPSDFPPTACPDTAACQDAATAAQAIGCYSCLP